MEIVTIDLGLHALPSLTFPEAPRLFDVEASRRLYGDVIVRALACWIPSLADLAGGPLGDSLKVPVGSVSDQAQVLSIVRLVYSSGLYLVPAGRREMYWWSLGRPDCLLAVRVGDYGMAGIYDDVPLEEAHDSLLPSYPYDPPGLRSFTDYVHAPAFVFGRTYMTVTEAAREACMAVATLRWQVERGRIPGAVKRGKTWLIPRPVVRALLAPVTISP